LQKINTTHPVAQGPDDTVSLQSQYASQTSLDIILTPILNSVQIVAPEVVLCKYYGKPADVFSFSILLWEMLALSQPFKSYDYEKHAQLVVQKNKRPSSMMLGNRKIPLVTFNADLRCTYCKQVHCSH